MRVVTRKPWQKNKGRDNNSLNEAEYNTHIHNGNFPHVYNIVKIFYIVTGSPEIPNSKLI